jgi:NADH:ubiquinone oxidoreductase subunit 6 (subunit J)
MQIEYIFILFSVIIVASALYVLWSKSVVHAAFMLLFTFLGVASIFVLGGADFLAVAQIMVYIGGILVLLVFGVLLTNKPNKLASIQSNRIESNNYNRILGGIVAFGVFGVLVYVFNKIPFTRLEGQHFEFYEPPISTIQSLGVRLVTDNSIALEAIGILLIGALIGAGFIAKSTISNQEK